MTNLAEHPVLAVRHSRGLKPSRKSAAQVVRCQDRRWLAIALALDCLRARNRRAVRIVDTDCGNGELLLCAVRQASALGFTAIEARGLDDAVVSVDRARASAACLEDPAIGISFDAIALASALSEESDFPADIVIAHHHVAQSDPIVANLLNAAGRILIVEPGESVELAA